jgi:hypothetical protein
LDVPDATASELLQHAVANINPAFENGEVKA